ncbi:MAG: glycerate 2-kinase [Mycobacterium sp.]|nr:glycerate 2-kinase [Mycobacterium sp.]
MHVLIAPDKFKGSLSAVQVATHVAAGLRSVLPDLAVRELPVADGGDGTVDAAVQAGFTRVRVRASGPTGVPVDSSYARRDDLAVIEMATVCGLLRLPGGRRDPLHASSYGLGEAVCAAAAAGCRRMVLGIGGSASTDGGAGMLQALGAHLLDERGRALPPRRLPLHDTSYTLDLAELDPVLRDVEIVVACDVDNPLFGSRGAAAVYAPQKGASPQDVALLDTALRRWAVAVAAATGTDWAAEPGAGAAGGVGFAALAVLGGVLRPGIQIVLDLLGFAEHLSDCRLVITGEGALDEQTLAGKAPAGVSAAARAAGLPVVVVTGRSTLAPADLAAAGIDAVYPLTELEPDPVRYIACAGPLLGKLGARIARDRLATPAIP